MGPSAAWATSAAKMSLDNAMTLCSLVLVSHSVMSATDMAVAVCNNPGEH
jgi:hypothetical protein